MTSYRQLATLMMMALGTCALAQRGKIITPATTTVMDPNGDGYVSLTDAGFSNDGIYTDEFEIPMFGLPVFEEGEVLNDTQAGPNCGTTDLTVDPDGFSAYAVLDDDNNLIFRLRLADEHPSVEAYTILIDTDGKLGDSDPNTNAINPGFEIDITLIKSNSKGVLVYNIDGVDSCPSPVLEYDLSSNFQLAIADIVSCGDEDYFYDFYLPFGDLTAEFGITVDSELQFAAVTNISGTCALAGKISDIGGVNDNDYAGCNSCAFTDLASNQCPVPFSNLCSTCEGFLSGATPLPTMEVPLKEGDIVISGTADPESDLSVDVFDLGDNLIGQETTVTDVDGNWTITLGAALVQGDSVTAVAQSEGKCDSGATGSQLSFAVVVLNTPPVLSGSGGTLVYTENEGEQPIYPDISAADTEDLNLDGATVTISSGLVDTEDMLTFTNQSGITGSYNSTTGVLVLTGSATLADYTSALQSVSYINGSEDPSETSRTVTYQINDGTENSIPIQKQIDVVAVNDPPVLNGTTGSTEYLWTPLVVNTTMNVTDVDDVQLTAATAVISGNFEPGEDFLRFVDQNGITGSFSSVSGELSLTGAASLADYATALNSIAYEYIPLGATSDLTRKIDFSVSDGTDPSGVFSHFIFYTGGTNNPPEIVDKDGFSIDNLTTETQEDVPLDLCLTAEDPDGDLVIIESNDPPVNGAITLTGGLCLEYDPNLNYSGTEVFDVIVCDQNLPVLCDTITVTLNVLPVNDAPDLNEITVDVDEKTTSMICLTAADLEGDTHEFTTGTSTTGTASDLTPGDMCFDYTPPDDFTGQDQVQVTICDTADPTVCDTGTITVNVIDINEPPSILVNSLPALNLSVNALEDSPMDFCFEVIDPEGDNVSTFNITNVSGGGSLTENATEFCYHYVPDPEYNGIAEWTVEVCDDATPSLCGTLTIQIQVQPVNDPPVLNEVTVSIDERTSTQICLTASDVEGNTHEFTSGTSAQNPGSVTDTSTGDLCFDYTPSSDFKGTDEITVTICDVDDPTVCDTGIITVNVNDVNEAPVFLSNNIVVDELQVETQEDVFVDFCVEISDPEGDIVTVSSLQNTAGGGIIEQGTGSFCYRYVPVDNYFGVSAWEMEICDDGDPALCSTATLYVSINPVNDSPEALPDTLLVMRNVTGSINVLTNDNDLDGDELAVSPQLLTQATGGTVTIEEDGTLTYLSEVTFRGTDSVTYELVDNGSPALTSSAKVIIIVDDNPFTIYQTISPNGDGINDYWHIEGIDFYPTNEVKLFDRYNNLVFEIDGYNNQDRAWTGVANRGSGGALEEGTYYYRISAGEAGVFTGFIVLRGE